MFNYCSLEKIRLRYLEEEFDTLEGFYIFIKYKKQELEKLGLKSRDRYIHLNDTVMFPDKTISSCSTVEVHRCTLIIIGNPMEYMTIECVSPLSTLRIAKQINDYWLNNCESLEDLFDYSKKVKC